MGICRIRSALYVCNLLYSARLGVWNVLASYLVSGNGVLDGKIPLLVYYLCFVVCVLFFWMGECLAWLGGFLMRIQVCMVTS